MSRQNVYRLFPPTTHETSESGSAPKVIHYTSESPGSSPTMMFEAEEVRYPTVLPAPPRVPSIAIEEWCAPPTAASNGRPQLVLVEPEPPSFSSRPTVRVTQLRSHMQRAVSQSSPPTVPPPSPALRRAA